MRGFFMPQIRLAAISKGTRRFPERRPRHGVLATGISGTDGARHMRNILFAASAIATLAIPSAASAQYYSTETYAAPPSVYAAPPAYVAPAPGTMVESQVY